MPVCLFFINVNTYQLRKKQSVTILQPKKPHFRIIYKDPKSGAFYAIQALPLSQKINSQIDTQMHFALLQHSYAS